MDSGNNSSNDRSVPAICPSDDKIQLEIIEKEIQQFAGIILQHNEEYHCNTGEIPSPPIRSFDFNAVNIAENIISKLQEILVRLSGSNQLNADDKSRVTELETTVDEIQKTLHMLKEKRTSGDETVSQLDTVAVADISIESSENKEDFSLIFNKILLEGIVSAIQRRQFPLADEQLQLTGDSTYEKAVEAVHDHNPVNIDLVQNFSDFVSNQDSKLKILQALFNQIRVSEHPDVWRMIWLAQSIKRDVLGHAVNTSAALSLFNSLGNAIEPAAIYLISDDLLDGGKGKNLWPNSNYSYLNLVTILVNDFPQFAHNICKEALDRTLYTLGLERIIKKANKIEHLESKILFHHVIFEKLESLGLVHTNLSMPFARGMKSVMDEKHYSYVHPSIRSRYEDMKNKLPKSIKTLLTASEVYIRNSFYNEYLFAADEEFLGYGHDRERRSVFTWIPKNETKSSNFKWKVNFIGNDHIELINVGTKEVMFACHYIRFDEERRMVFTLRLRGCYLCGNITLWNIDVDGDGIQIKNVGSKEYLFADGDKKLDNSRRYVFTHTRKHKTMASKWEIIDCAGSSY